MAINYLNSINLNKNELLQGVIENQPNDAAAGASPVEGQLYFNTTDHVLKQYNGTAWKEVGGGVETLTTTDSTYINLTPNSATAGAVTVTAALSAIDGTAVAATRFLSKDNTWDIPTVDNYGYWVLDADGNGATANIKSGDTVDFVGGLKIGTNSTAGGTLNITHDLQTQTDSTSAVSPALGATFTVVDSVTRDTTGHATGLNVKTITLPTTAVTQSSGDNSTKIATTAFVQASVTGLLEFKGGFNASTGAIVGGGNLTSGATRVAVSVGDYYVVTADGDFFGNAATPLTVGDSVIVQTAAVVGASVEADFIVVQSDTDLATATTVGLGNVVADTAVEYDGLRVTYSAGTATVGLDIDSLPTETLNYGASDIIIPYVNDQNGEQKKASLDDLILAAQAAVTRTGTIAIGALTGSVVVPASWGLNSMVQTINAVGDTVFCDVTRASTSVTATISAAQSIAITILVQKIG